MCRGILSGGFCLDIFKAIYCPESKESTFFTCCVLSLMFPVDSPVSPIFLLIHRKPPTKWKHGKWSPCSVACGVGTKTRIVQCIREDTGALIQESLCESRKPRSRRRCLSQRCPTKIVQGVWIFGAWGPVCDFSYVYINLFSELWLIYYMQGHPSGLK